MHHHLAEFTMEEIEYQNVTEQFQLPTIPSVFYLCTREMLIVMLILKAKHFYKI